MKTPFPLQPQPLQNFKNKTKTNQPTRKKTKPTKNTAPTKNKGQTLEYLTLFFSRLQLPRTLACKEIKSLPLKSVFLSVSFTANPNTVRVCRSPSETLQWETIKVYTRILAPSTKTSYQLDKDCLVKVLAWV